MRDVVEILPLTEWQLENIRGLPDHLAVVPHVSARFGVVAYLASSGEPTALLVDSDGAMFHVSVSRLRLVDIQAPPYDVLTGQRYDPAGDAPGIEEGG